MQLELLGGFRLTTEVGEAVRVPLRRAQALLAYLAVQQGPSRSGGVSRDALLDLLWPDRFKEQAQSSLRQVVFHLGQLDENRAALIETTRGDIALGPAVARSDVWSLQAMAGSDDARELARMAELWRGPLLAGFGEVSVPFSQWLAMQQARAEQLLEDGLLRAAAQVAEKGDATAAIALLRRLLDLSPFCYRGALSLMRMLAATDRVTDARAAFERFRRGFVAEFGEEPPEALRTSYAALGAGVPASGKARSAARPQLIEASADRQETPPVIAVLPFDERGAGGQASALGSAIAEDILLMLSRCQWFRVLSRRATDTLAALWSVEPAEFARRLGVDYLVCGTLSPQGDGTRIDVELLTGLNGQILWTERFDVGRGAVPDQLSDLSVAIAAAIDPQLLRREYALLAQPSLAATRSASAYGRLVAGYHHFYGGRADEALACFRAAAEADPGFAHAHAMLAYLTYFRGQVGRGPALGETEWQEVLRSAEAHARRALELDDREAKAQVALAQALSWQGRHDEAGVSIESAVRLNPSYSMASAARAYHALMTGALEDARTFLDTAMRLRVGDRGLGHCLPAQAFADFHSGEHRRALETAHWANRLRPDFWLVRQVLACSLAAAGEAGEAERFIAALRQDFAGLSADQFAAWVPYAGTRFTRAVADRLTAAGWR